MSGFQNKHVLKFSLALLIIVYSFIPQLSPSSSDILEQHKKELFDARQYSRKLNAVLLSDKPNDKEGKDEKDTKLEQVC